MSKEQIDRILNSDFSIIDNTIDAKINSIDQITGKLTQKSNFLAQFQLLLQTQLSGIHKKPNPPALPQNQVKGTTKLIQPQANANNSFLQKDQLFQIHEHNFPEIKQQSTVQKRCLDFDLQMFNSMKQKVNDLRHLFYCIKEEIKNEIQFLKLVTKETVQNIMATIQAEQQSKYKAIINELQLEIVFLRQKNKTLTQQSQNPLKELTFQQSHEEEKEYCFNITKRLKKYEDHSILYSPAPRNTQPVLNSEQWKTYRLKFDQHPQNQPDSFKSKPSPSQPYSIPILKNISVGVPPIKNGFGVLKSANEVIYRGMWKDGKFNGSGKLNWDGYCYEGNFQNGSFQGHGRLQIKNMVYVGKFKDNKLWGEGTLQVGGKRVVGVWQRNKLTRMF